MELRSEDTRLILYLREAGVARFSDLISRFYKNYEQGRKRLKGLEQSGVLEFRTLGELKSLSPILMRLSRELGLSDHWRKSKVASLKSGFGGSASDFSRYSSLEYWCHQLMVNELQREWEELLPQAQVETEGGLLFRSLLIGEPEGLYPDLILTQSAPKPLRIALECERTLKSKERMEEKLYAYRRATSYSHILYICGNLTLAKTILHLGRIERRLGVSTFQDRDTVYLADGSCISRRGFVESLRSAPQLSSSPSNSR